MKTNKYTNKKNKPSSIFLDSGAYSISTRNFSQNTNRPFHKTKKFKEYVDAYCMFLKENEYAFNHYVNVDVLGDPYASYKTLKYMERKYGLHPVPVVHYGTDECWLKKYIDEGYSLIGFGGKYFGKGKASTLEYKGWADRMFEIVCNTNDHLPRVHIHGFAMTSYALMRRYPWWSVDSTSWTKWAAYGIIYVPRIKGRSFDFERNPYPIFVSQESPQIEIKGRHILTLRDSAPNKFKILKKWLKEIDVPLGSESEWGILNENSARTVANLRFFERAIDSLPDWPWPFIIKGERNHGYTFRDKK